MSELQFAEAVVEASPRGDRARCVRITVENFGGIKRENRERLRVVLMSTPHRRLKWSLGTAVLVDGSAPHAEVVAILTELGVTWTEKVLEGVWRVARGVVVLRVPEGVAREADALAVGMPVLSRRLRCPPRQRLSPRASRGGRCPTARACKVVCDARSPGRSSRCVSSSNASPGGSRSTRARGSSSSAACT